MKGFSRRRFIMLAAGAAEVPSDLPLGHPEAEGATVNEQIHLPSEKPSTASTRSRAICSPHRPHGSPPIPAISTLRLSISVMSST